MIIDPILKTGITGGVGAGLALKHDRAAIGHDQTGPDQQHTGLTERNLAVIDPYQTRPLRAKRSASTSKAWHFLPTTS
jgi:hypothetical protein